MSVLKKNIIFNLIGQGLLMLLSFFSFKYLYSGLGEDALGIIYFSLMLSVLFSSALDMGLTKTTIRELAAHYDSETIYVRRLTQTFSFFYLLAYLIVTTLFVFSSQYIVDLWLNLTTMNNKLALNVLLVIGVSSLLTIPKMFLSSICIGLQKMGINNFIEVSIATFQQAGMIMLLLNGSDVLVIAYWIAFTNVLKVSVYFVFVSNLLSVKFLFPIFSFDTIRRVKSYTKKMFLVSLILVVHKQIDKLLISKLLPIGVLGVYSFVFLSIGKTSLVTGAVAQAAFPAFSEMDRKGQRKNLFEKFVLLQELLVFCTLPIFIAVVFFSMPLFTFLLDEQKAESLQITIFLLAFSFYMNAILRLVRTYMFAINKPNPIIRSDFLSLFVVVPTAVYLIYSMGMNGAALSWVVFYILMAILIIPTVFEKEFELSVMAWLKPVLSAFLIAIVTYLPAGYLCLKINPSEIFLFILCYFLASILYILLAINIMGVNIQRAILLHLPFFRYIIINHHGIA